MNDLIYHCDIYINKEKLLDEYHELSNKLSTFSRLNPEWLKVHEVGTYGNQLKEMFQKDFDRVAVGYYHQPAGIVIKEHTDGKCKCRINVRLNDDDSLLEVNNKKYDYDCSLINVSKYPHSVTSSKTDRILFSIMFINDNFLSVKKELKKILKSEKNGVHLRENRV